VRYSFENQRNILPESGCSMMSFFNSFPQNCRCESKRILTLGFVAGWSIVLFVTGCHKNENSSAAPPVQGTNAASADYRPDYSRMTTDSQSVAVQANGEPDLSELDRHLRRWLVQNRRRPANFEEFAATAGIAIPPPPAGKKYVITKRMHVQLVNQ
jgi:hypothetical protein